jgi:pSer/pThr/pTyr-binding forkhead associated (FHA) protein
VITCPKCTKENQDHYKFCLGCGAELPRDASPKKFAPGTPPHGVPAVRPGIADESTSQGAAGVPRASNPRAGQAPMAMGGGGAGAQPSYQPAPVNTAHPPSAVGAGGGGLSAGPGGAPPVICPQCEHPNPSSNKFCASCGFKLARPQSMQPQAVPAAAAGPGGGVVLTALRADGTEAGTYSMPAGTVTIGRDRGWVFAGDSYLSPRHATFTPRSGKLFVRDESSLNGIYRKLRRDEPVSVRFGDVFRIGQEIVRLEALTTQQPNADGVERLGSPAKGYVGRIALVVGRDATGNAYPIPESGLHLGRERGDVLFPEDGYVSGLHCRLSHQDGHLFLTDLGSSNGSFIRLSAETEIVNGDILLMGQQLFRITL